MHRVWTQYLEQNGGGGHGPPYYYAEQASAEPEVFYETDGTLRPRKYSTSSADDLSTHSHATSTRHLMADRRLQNTSGALDAPSPLFASATTSSLSLSPTTMPLLKDPAGSPLPSPALSVNYLPSKFSSALIGGGGTPRRRKNGKKALEPAVPKIGGGREAFRSGEARMPAEGDEDYDGVGGGGSSLFGGAPGRRKRLRWNKFKWTLFVTNTLLTMYSLTALIFCLLTWFNVWPHADVVRVGNRTELALSTAAAALGVLTALVGWSGLLLNNRAFLALYTFLLWPCFALLVAPGYVAYKRRAFDLEGKVNAQWSRALGVRGRLRVQDALGCCGYFSPFVEAAVSPACYARAALPGCKAAFLAFERAALARWYTVAFALVPLQLAVMLAGLLCANHVTYRFGKGMMPKAYRLSLHSMAVIMENYAKQLAEEYGDDVAKAVLARARTGAFAPPSTHYANPVSLSSKSSLRGTPD